LERPPELVNLMIEGIYFHNKVCPLYSNSNVKETQVYRLTDEEWVEDISEGIRNVEEWFPLFFKTSVIPLAFPFLRYRVSIKKEAL